MRATECFEKFTKKSARSAEQRDVSAMPVPVSVTHGGVKAAGLKATVLVEMETEGPFARLKAAKAAEPQAAQPRFPEVPTPSPQAGTPDTAPENPSSTEQPAISVNHLSFGYPGLGEGQPMPAPAAGTTCGMCRRNPTEFARSGILILINTRASGLLPQMGGHCPIARR